MGVVDRMDQNIASYRTQFRSKEWRAPFFNFMPDVSVQNSWLMYRSLLCIKINL